MVKLEKNNHLQLLPNNNGCKANNYNMVSQAKHNCTQYSNTSTPIPTSIVTEPTTNALAMHQLLFLLVPTPKV